MLNKLYEFYYYVSGKAYYVCYVTSNNRRIKRFIQLASITDKGADIMLYSTPLKCAWHKPDSDSIIIDGLKFLCFLDINNAIPLKIVNEDIKKTGEIINTEYKRTIISEDIEKQKKNPKSGRANRLVEIAFPPTVLFQEKEAHFVKQILSVPHEKNDYLMWVLIIGLVIFGIIGFVWLKFSGVM